MQKRIDIDPRYKWSIDDMFNDQTFDSAYQTLDSDIAKAADYQGRLSTDDQSIGQLFELRQKTGMQLSELFTFARMKLDEDNKAASSQTRLQKINGLGVKYNAAFSFVEPELLSLDQAALRAKFNSDSALADYDHYIDDLLRKSQHYLSVEQESVLAQLSDTQGAPASIFNMLESADLTFDDVTMPDGSTEQLTAGNFSKFLYHTDRTVRKCAFDNLYKSYSALGNTLATIYTSSVKKDTALAKMRDFQSSVAMSLFEDNIDLAVYDHLVSATVDRLDLYARYLDIRKQMLGLDELHPYDLYVPMVSEVAMSIPFDKGFSMVKEALKPLGERYQTLLDKAKDQRWIDVYSSVGKSAGAYSWGTYQSKPFILLNYNDNIDDVTTLAHELGHSMHSYLSIDKQPYAKYHYSLFVAEVASTVNEAIMMCYLIDNSQSKAEKMYLLNSFMEIIRTTIYRQVMFAEFERHVHRSFEADQPLSLEALNADYLALNQKYFGDKVTIDDALKYEWSRIPHFYRSFYVYGYATGLSAALYISKRIIEGDQQALDGYYQFLSAGGSLYPLEALKLADIDMTNPQTFYAAFDFFEQILDEFESLM